MSSFPSIRINDGQRVDIGQMYAYWSSNRHRVYYDCFLCRKNNIERTKIGHHLMNACKCGTREQRLMIQYIFRQFSTEFNPSSPIIMVDECVTKGIYTVVQNDGLIKRVKSSDIVELGMDLKALKRKYRRHFKEKSEGFLLILEHLAKQGHVLHSLDSNSTCENCYLAFNQEFAMNRMEDGLNDKLTTFNIRQLPAREGVKREFRRIAYRPGKHVAVLSETTKAWYKTFIRNNFKGFEEVEKYFNRHLNGRSGTSRNAPIISTLFQAVRISIGDDRRLLPKLQFASHMTRQIVFDGILNIFTDKSLNPSTIANKVQYLKRIYQYICTLNQDRSVLENAKRFVQKLSSYELSKRPAREANATKRDGKTKLSLIEKGEYISSKELTDLGALALGDCMHTLDSLKASKLFLYPTFYKLQTALLVCLMTKGACYRSEEYRFMVLNTTERLQDGSWKSYVENNKNRNRKERGALLFFDRKFDFLLTGFMAIRMSIANHCNFVFISKKNAQLKATDLASIVRGYCHEKFPHYTKGTPMSLRYLQSAHLWSMYKSGAFTAEQMEKLGKLFDRNLETWERDYSFTDDVLDRNPGEELSLRLWKLNDSAEDKEWDEIDRLQFLRKLNTLATAVQDDNDDFSETASIDDDMMTSIIGSDRTPIKVDKEGRSNRTSRTVQEELKENNQVIVELDEVENFQSQEPLVYWISDDRFDLHLYERDRQTLVTPGGWLIDSVVLCSLLLAWHQKVIENVSKPYDYISGTRPIKEKTNRLIQHFNVRGNHWILGDIKLQFDNMNRVYYYQVDIYDSLAPSNGLIDRELDKKLRGFLGNNYQYDFIFCQQQEGGNDCGLFVVATAWDLFANRRVRMDFNQSMMRQHLTKCLEQRCVSAFPAIQRNI